MFKGVFTARSSHIDFVIISVTNCVKILTHIVKQLHIELKSVVTKQANCIKVTRYGNQLIW